MDAIYASQWCEALPAASPEEETLAMPALVDEIWGPERETLFCVRKMVTMLAGSLVQGSRWLWMLGWHGWLALSTYLWRLRWTLNHATIIGG